MLCRVVQGGWSLVRLRAVTGQLAAPLRSLSARPPIPERGDPDTFGTVSTPLSANQLVSEAADAALGDDDGEAAYRAKIADVHRPRPHHYLRQMNELLRPDTKTGRPANLASALRIMDVDMKRECVKPREKHYRVLIHACGKAGYTLKAFQLFREYVTRKMDFNFGIYSDLFNACANSPQPEFALEKARGLRTRLLQQHGTLPPVVYHNMLKAFGRCGDLESAFSVVDEMRRAQLPVDAETYALLLHGCIADKRAGFRHAVLIWRKLLEDDKDKKKGKGRDWASRAPLVQPNIYLYNLLLRAAKECRVGDESFTYDILLACMSVKEAREHRLRLEESAGGSRAPLPATADDDGAVKVKEGEAKSERKQLKFSQIGDKFAKGRGGPDTRTADCSRQEGARASVGAGPEQSVDGDSSSSSSGGDDTDGGGNNIGYGRVPRPTLTAPTALEIVHLDTPSGRPPNLLELRPSFRDVVSLGSLERPQERFALLGGLDGFCDDMRLNKVQPDVKTFSQMLNLVGDNEDDENRLIDAMDQMKVEPDIDFFNQLIKRRAFRRDYALARETLHLVNKYGLSVDLLTFGVLSLGCRNVGQAVDLLKSMDQLGLRVNAEILDTMLKTARMKCDARMVLVLLKNMDSRDVMPTERTLRHLENFYKEFKKFFLRLERGETGPEAGKRIPTAVKTEVEKFSCENFRQFHPFYKTWLRKTEVELPDHPWKQFLTARDMERMERDDRIQKIVDNRWDEGESSVQ